MFAFRFLAAFGSATDTWAMSTVLLPLPVGGQTLLLAGGAAQGQYHLLDSAAQGSVLRASYPLNGPLGTFMLSDAALLSVTGGWQLWSVSHTGSQILRHGIGPGGGLSSLSALEWIGGVRMEVSVIETVMVGGQAYLATAAHDSTSLSLIRPQANGSASLVTQVTDTPKSTLDGVTDMVSLTIDGEVYLLAASSRSDGLSSFHIGVGGILTLTDSLTPKDGLWVDGLDALATVALGGIHYVIAGSAAAGSLSVIRVNALGVMFVTDQMLDDRNTRFDGVTRIETVTVNGRALVLAGGGDGGISLLEVLPDGRLFHHQSLEARGAWSGLAQTITGLSMTVQDGTLRIHAAGPGGLSVFEVGLQSLGPLTQGGAGGERLSGTAGDDLIFGGGGADTLIGGAGDDLLIATGAGTRFEGGGGADVFRIGAGGGMSSIADFQPGVDRIDLSEWGRIYDISALTIRARSFGAELSYGDQILRVSLVGGGRIEPASWSADHFLFG